MTAEQHNLKCLLNYRSDNFLTIHCIETGFLMYINWLKNHIDYLLLFPTSLFLLPHIWNIQVRTDDCWNGLEIRSEKIYFPRAWNAIGPVLGDFNRCSWVDFLTLGRLHDWMVVNSTCEEKIYDSQKTCFLVLNSGPEWGLRVRNIVKVFSNPRVLIWNRLLAIQMFWLHSRLGPPFHHKELGGIFLCAADRKCN